ncbi:MAG: hypothetical protein HY903_17270 [Deltaproteobacteria bacterium]|nr:hypothetical protein [Deltaproteobacteria bacterium]
MRALPLVMLSSLGLGSYGCNDCPSREGPQVAFDPTLKDGDGNPATWLSFPFPSDHRRVDGGNIRVRDFPDPDHTEILSSYTHEAEATLDGFGTNSPVYLSFKRPLDLGTLSADPGALASPTAPLQLVDVTETSPEYGRRRPLGYEYWADAGKYVPANTLAVAPAWGLPLSERTTYALVATADLHDTAGDALEAPPLLSRLLGDDVGLSCFEPAVDETLVDALTKIFEPLTRLFERESWDTDRVAAATVFTTQTITRPLAEIRAAVTTELRAPTPKTDGWQEKGGAGGFAERRTFQWNGTETTAYWVLEGRFESPSYQKGTLPYAAPRDGGAFNVVDGKLTPDHYESLRFVLTVPEAPPANDAPCYPIVLFAHGTGGDAYDVTDGTAGRLAGRGLAGIGIDQPLHGLRNEGKTFDVSIMSFNLFNAAAARANFRQSAVDTFSLTRMVREALTVPAGVSPTGEDICFDPAKVSFFGHSHGGLTGSLAAALETDIGAWVFSGAGGGLSITLMERKDMVDFKAFLTLLLYLDPADEPLTEMHPAIGLVQALVEITDPINYAPHWLGAGGEPGAKSVFMTSGEHDAATPHRTASALAVAAHLPVVEPVVIPIPAYDWIGLPAATAPVSGNAGAKTAGFIQWTNDRPGRDYDSHWLIFYRPEAIHASMRFLQSAAYEATPVIERLPNADVR